MEEVVRDLINARKWNQLDELRSNASWAVELSRTVEPRAERRKEVEDAALNCIFSTENIFYWRMDFFQESPFYF